MREVRLALAHELLKHRLEQVHARQLRRVHGAQAVAAVRLHEAHERPEGGRVLEVHEQDGRVVRHGLHVVDGRVARRVRHEHLEQRALPAQCTTAHSARAPPDEYEYEHEHSSTSEYSIQNKFLH